MAEVPEVETIVRDLRAAVVGRTLHQAEVFLPAAVRFPSVDEFTSALTDRVVLDAQRRAQYILLALSGDLVLAGAPADADAWRQALERIEAERESLAAEAASPLVELEVLLPDLVRAAALAPAAVGAAAGGAVLRSGIALGDVEILALLRSPRVLAAERTFRASLEQYSQVAALDEVVRSYASATGSLMAPSAAGWPARARASPSRACSPSRWEVDSADVRAARAELGRARRDALAEARRLCWDTHVEALLLEFLLRAHDGP